MAHATKHRWTWAFLPATLALLMACTGFSVRYDFDPHGSFQGLRTWDWAPAPPRAHQDRGPEGNSLMDRRVREAVATELAARGFRQASGAKPDFQVVYFPVYHRRVVQTYSATGPMWGWPGPGPWGGFPPMLGVSEVQAYEEGTLVLEILDPGNGQVIWQASAVGALTWVRDPRDADQQVARAVKALLAKFPPPPRR